MPKKTAKPRKIGVRQIAAAANVSAATVSRVLNGSSSVDPELQRVVLSAVAKFKIDPAQWNKTKSLVFLLGNRAFVHAFHSHILLGAEEYCAENGWELFFLSFKYSPQTPWDVLHLPTLVQRRDLVRGVILAGTHSRNLLELLTHRGLPFVALGNNLLGDSRDLCKDIVFSDDIRGGQDITRHLISIGHRDIWFVGNLRLPWFARCFEGYCRAMSEAGLAPLQSDIDFEDDGTIGYLGAKSVLSSGKPVTAIFAGNDPTAHGVYRALRDCGLDVPADISVAGCNDTLGTLLYPPLTTIREFPEQLGRRMAELLLNRVANPLQDQSFVTIPTEFVKRDSTGPAASGVSASAEPHPAQPKFPTVGYSMDRKGM